MITPGPVVITVGFIGYLVAGFSGAMVAAVATFLPCYLLTILPAPYFKKHGKRPGILAFVAGVTAAARADAFPGSDDDHEGESRHSRVDDERPWRIDRAGDAGADDACALASATTDGIASAST